MREIKFRAWDKEDKEIIYEALEIRNIGLGDGSVLIDERTQKGNELIWMQYTGLKDKNDKEIYEGDVLKFKNGCMGIVIYEAPSWGVDWGGVKNFLGIFYDKTEIIGNIYENPELIKE